MPKAAKGLYATVFVDATFIIMGGASALMLLAGQDKLLPQGTVDVGSLSGLFLFALVVLVALSACLYHAVDRKGWDDYMGQIVTQSAMIGMVSIILTGFTFELLLGPNVALTRPPSMIQGMLPIAGLSWAIGYGFLRIRGTNT